MSAAAALVFARCAGFVFRAPGLSHPSVPAPVRAGLALFLTVALLPSIRGGPGHFGAAFVCMCALEFAIGSAMGLAASVLYDGAYAAGRMLDDYVGIRASIPAMTVSASSGFGRLWSLALLTGFFLLDGYRIVILALARSFVELRPGAVIDDGRWLIFAFSLPVLIFKAALLIAGPAVAVAFVMQCGLGALSRAVTRFQSFTLSFPLVFACVLLVTAATLPAVYRGGGNPWIALPFGRR